MNANTMTFGKHKGLMVSEVPTSYLTWALDTLPKCPAYIVLELTRRGSTESGAGLLAQTAANNAFWRNARKTRKQNTKFRRQQKRKTDQAGRSREAALTKMDALKSGAEVVGCNYESSLQAFVDAGGDLSACPFDCKEVLSEA